MKNNSQTKNNSRNMTTKKTKTKTNSLTTQVSEWVINTLSNTLPSEQVQTVRNSLESNQSDLQKILNKDNKQTITKKEKDPEAPKRGKSSYIFYCIENRQKIQTKNPNMSAKDIIKELGSSWRTLTDTQKDKYIKLADGDKQRYTGEISEYTPSDKFLSSKKVKSTGPKRGLTAYIFFCNEQRNVVKESNPKLSNKELTSELGKKWNLLTDEQKKPYASLAEKDKSRYENDKNLLLTTTTPKSTDKTTPKSTEKSTEKSTTKTATKSTTKTATKPTANTTSAKSTAKTTAKTTAVKSTAKTDTKSTKKTEVSNAGFLLFCEEEREILQEEHPKWTNSQLTKELGKAWNELKEYEQEEYNEKATGELVEEE
jgi:hypothetical protein